MANKTSQHILNTSANLLGFCLFVITSIHLSDKAEMSLIDELTSVIALLLTISSMLSFISIRTENIQKEERLERFADYLFSLALGGIFIIVLFILANFLNN